MDHPFELYQHHSNTIFKEASLYFPMTHPPSIQTIQTQHTPCIWLSYEQIQSTMIPAQHWPEELTEGLSFAFQARSQTQGKGQGTNTWTSPPGNIYLTVLTRIKPNVSTLLSIIACSAVLKTIRQQLPHVKAQCKWINDIFIDDKKAAGLLTSCTIYGQKFLATVGVGLNITAAPLEGSTCLMNHAQGPIDIERISKRLIINILQGLQNKDQLLNLYQESLMFKGRQVKIMDKQLKTVLEKGVFRGINEFGHAVVQKQGEEVVVHSGRMREDQTSAEIKQNAKEDEFDSKPSRSQYLL